MSAGNAWSRERPFGIKLVYYKISGGRLYLDRKFEPWSRRLTRDPDVDPSFVESFPTIPIYAVTLHNFQGIMKLAPGTMLTCENGDVQRAAVVSISNPPHFRRQSRSARLRTNCSNSTNRQ